MPADVLYAAPTAEPLTVDEAKEHMLVEFNDDDALISALIVAAREYCEKVQNRAIITQTRDKWLDEWPAVDYIEIKSPLASVTHIKYYGADNTEYTMANTDYFVDSKSFVGRVGLAYDVSWPTTTLRPFNGVNIRYVCGAATAEQIVKEGLLLLVGHLYRNREAGTERALQEIPFGVNVLLGLDRKWPV